MYQRAQHAAPLRNRAAARHDRLRGVARCGARQKIKRAGGDAGPPRRTGATKNRSCPIGWVIAHVSAGAACCAPTELSCGKARPPSWSCLLRGTAENQKSRRGRRSAPADRRYEKQVLPHRMCDCPCISGRSMLRPYGIELRQGTTAFVELPVAGHGRKSKEPAGAPVRPGGQALRKTGPAPSDV